MRYHANRFVLCLFRKQMRSVGDDLRRVKSVGIRGHLHEKAQSYQPYLQTLKTRLPLQSKALKEVNC